MQTSELFTNFIQNIFIIAGTYTTYYLTLAYYYKTICYSHNSGAIVGSDLDICQCILVFGLLTTCNNHELKIDLLVILDLQILTFLAVC